MRKQQPHQPAPVDAPALTTENETMVMRLERAIRVVAYVIATHNQPGYAPLLDRLERELAYYREGRDPISRARAILQSSSSSVY